MQFVVTLARMTHTTDTLYPLPQPGRPDSPEERSQPRSHQPNPHRRPPILRDLTARALSAPAWVFLIQLFIGLGWLRAAAEKLIDPGWWTGDVLVGFVAAQQDSVLQWYAPFLNSVVVPAAPLIAFLVLAAQLLAGLCLVSGRRLSLGLGVGIVMNLSFMAAGAVTPSVFYLLAQGAVLLWMAERNWSPQMTLRLHDAAVASLFLIGLNVPFISTIDPAEVIEDPALMFVFGGLLSLSACAVAYVRNAIDTEAR